MRQYASPQARPVHTPSDGWRVHDAIVLRILQSVHKVANFFSPALCQLAYGLGQQVALVVLTGSTSVR
ncbi:hypothetical protein NDU88_003943 [Pleurodeles waltl]|uniref:Uncharacterized protein n=1 Tax=Pleurodeles waltl TaxID=8319 RepID=A0AAV7L5B1_PLEWA|nr:hypothetical protein NDU88_003943 [Pleurodeles waltl]